MNTANQPNNNFTKFNVTRLYNLSIINRSKFCKEPFNNLRKLALVNTFVAEILKSKKFQQQQQLQQLLAENERLRAENQLAQATRVENQVNVCINNLRQIDSAKQQWALENKKSVAAIPTAQEILPYLKDQIFPVCPSGRAYAINAVALVPTCSIPGHALAQP